MTDNEIIKAADACVRGDCIGCSHNSEDSSIVCRDKLIEDMRDLINRQKAEIERLNHIRAELSKEIDIWKDIAKRETGYVGIARTEAFKEFAERLKSNLGYGWILGSAFKIRIDNLVKEMTEEVQ